MVMIVIFPLYVQFVEWVVPGVADLALADGSKPNIMPHIAASHTIFNFANMLVFLPFVGLLSRLVSVIIKEKPVEEQEERLVHLHYDSFGIPNLMIREARREIEKMYDMATLMFITSREFLFQNKNNSGNELLKMKAAEDEVDVMQEEIVRFLATVSGHRALTERDIEDIHIFTRLVDETESIADYSYRLIELVYRKVENNIVFSEEAMKDLETIFSEMFDFVTLAKMYFRLHDERMEDDFNKKSREINILIEEANKSHITRLQEGVCEAIPAVYFTSFLGNLRRLRSHTINIVEAARGEK
jgi:phosphate:Na+ symporter